MKHRICFSLFLTAISIKLFVLPVALLGQEIFYGTPTVSNWMSASGRAHARTTDFTSQGDTIFAAHNGLGIIFSTDNGSTWQRSSMTFPTQIIQSNGARLLTVANRTPYFSNDAGATWLKSSIDTVLDYTVLGSTEPINLCTSAIKEKSVILCSYWNFSTHPATGSSTLFLTEDGGLKWKKVGKTPTSGYGTITFIGTMLITAGSKLTDTTHIFSSPDFGKTWKKCTPIPERVIKLYSHKSLLFAATYNDSANNFININNPDAINLFVSADTGKSWRQCASPHDLIFPVPFPLPTPEQKGRSSLPENLDAGISGIETLTFDEKGQIILGLRNNLLYRSSDTGRSWNIINSYLWKSRAYLTKTVFVKDTSIFVGGLGIYRCTSSGANMETLLATGFEQRFWFPNCQSEIKFITTVGRRKKIYFMAGFGGLSRSFDGWIWQPLFPKLYRWRASDERDIDLNNFFDPLTNGSYFSSLDGDYCVSAIAGNDDIILALSRSGSVLRSMDKGVTWRKIFQDTRFASDTTFLLEHKSMFIAVVGGNGYRSPDNGATWQPIPEINRTTISNVRTLTANSSSLFLSTDNKILTSSNSGHSWVNASFPRKSAIIDNIAATDSILYAATNEGVFRSTNGGKGWEEANEGLSSAYSTTRNIVALDNQNAIVVQNNCSISITSDGGKNWLPNVGLNSEFIIYSIGIIQTIRSIATNNSSFLALTKEHGVLRASIPIQVKTSHYVWSVDTVQTSLTVAPNPASGFANFGWFQRKEDFVSLTIFDALGRTVFNLSRRLYPAGVNRYEWDAQAITSGAYFYRFFIGSRLYSGTLMIAK